MTGRRRRTSNPMGLDTGFRSHCRLRSRDQAHRLVPAVALPGLGGTVSQRARFQDTVAWVLIAPSSLFALMPPWWTEPITRRDPVPRIQSEPRSRRSRFRFEFLGHDLRDPHRVAPWYNTLVWTVLVTPVGFLLMGVIGFWDALRNGETSRSELLIAGHWIFLMLLGDAAHAGP